MLVVCTHLARREHSGRWQALPALHVRQYVYHTPACQLSGGLPRGSAFNFRSTVHANRVLSIQGSGCQPGSSVCAHSHVSRVYDGHPCVLVDVRASVPRSGLFGGYTKQLPADGYVWDILECDRSFPLALDVLVVCSASLDLFEFTLRAPRTIRRVFASPCCW